MTSVARRFAIAAMCVFLPIAAQAQAVEEAAETVSDVADAAEEAVEQTAEQVEEAAEVVAETSDGLPAVMTPPTEAAPAGTEATAEEASVSEESTEPSDAVEGDDATAEDEAAADAEPQVPAIACDEPVYEFGEVDNTTSISHTFEIRNDGDALLQIGRVKPACGCTVAKITSKSLAPGESAEITTKLSLKNKVGPQRKTIAIESNDPNKPKLTLSLVGVAKTEVEVKPRRIYVANAIQGEPNEQKITLTSSAETPLNITGIATGNPHVTAELVETDAEGVFTIVVRTTENLAKGKTHGNIRISTDSAKHPVVNVPFQFQVIGELSVAPTEITMVAQPDVMLSRNLVVRPGTLKEFEITDVVPPVETIETHVREMGGNGFMVQLKNVEPSMALNGQKLIIRTTAEDMAEVVVPFRVIERPKR